jgi:hypothetical protein
MLMGKMIYFLTDLRSSSLPMLSFTGKNPNEGCKDEKNTVILNSHASNPLDIRFARHYKVSQA